jgi:lipopolysaccharide export LptBFGC system permease protein LptF
VRLVRFNELTAMLAAGVPLLRIAAPIVIASLILNALLLVDQELIIPRIIPKLVRKHDQIRQDSGPAFPVYSMRDNANGLLVASRFHPATATTNAYMEHIDVIERDADRQPVSHIVADRADWDARAQQWNLTNGVRTTGLAPHDRHRTHAPIDIYASSITPDEIALYHSGNYVQLLSTEKINQLLQRPQSYGTLALQRVKHFRFTQPLANIIILLLAAACVLTREPGQLKNGIVKSSIFTGACMATIFIAQNLAGQPPNETWLNTWPALMAWLPLIIFGPVAVWLLDRVKT